MESKISKPEPTFQGAPKALLENAVNYNNYYGSSTNTLVNYRPDRSTNFALSKVGIFNPIPFADVPGLVLEQQLPPYFIELEHSLEYARWSKDLQKNNLRSVKVEKTTRHSGSRRQKRRLYTTLKTSEVTLQEHALKRIYERSSIRALDAQSLFFPPSKYLKILYQEITEKSVEIEQSIFATASNFLYPFKTGAFIGSLALNPNSEWQTWEVDLSNGDIQCRQHSYGMPSFSARTFISTDMMTNDQTNVCNLLSVGEYESAVRQMIKIARW